MLVDRDLHALSKGRSAGRSISSAALVHTLNDGSARYMGAGKLSFSTPSGPVFGD